MKKTKLTLLATAITVYASHIKEEEMKLKSFYENKSVLVTGGCGFIGSHIVEKLVSLGARVTILDDLSTGNLENITSCRDRVTLMRHSIEDKNACLQAVQGQDIVFHLAAFISVPQSIEQPQQCHDINVNGTVNLLQAARAHKIQRFVFSSSCSVYGEYQGVCTEDAPTNPASPYALSKLIGELHCKQYYHIYQVPTVILRYFNVYGERQNPHAAYAAVYAKFSYLMANNLPITIFGDGLQTRDFILVTEVVRANLMAGTSEKQLVAGEIFNVGTGKSITILELIQQLKSEYPEYTGTIELAPERPGDIRHVRSGCDKFKRFSV